MTKSLSTYSEGNLSGVGFTQLRDWVGSKRAIGYPLTIFVLIYPIAIGSLQQTFSGYELPLPSWLWDLLLGVGAAAVLLLAKFLKVPRSFLANLAIFAIAALCGAILPILASIPVGGVAEHVIRGIPFSALSLLGLQLFFTLARGALSEYRASNKELFRIASELEIRRENLNSELAERQKAIANQILSEVEPRISSIQDLLRNSDSKQAAGEILSLIDNLVRPLSQGLAVSNSLPSDQPVAVSRKPSLKALRRRFTRKLAVSSILTPHLHVLFAVGFFVPAMFLAAGATGVLYLAGFLLAQILVFWICRTLVHQFQLPHWVLLIANVCIASLGNILFVLGSELAGLADPEGLIAFVGLGISLVFTAAGYVSIYSAAKHGAHQEIRQATERLAYLVGELQLRTVSLRKQFALDLHGDLQAKLQAALVRLERSTSNDPEVINQVLHDLAGATEGIENPNSKPESIELLRALPGLWNGICEVTINLDSYAEARLSENQGLSAVVVEIVRERIINAVKHSSAEEIDISIQLDGDVLVISSRNEDLGVGLKLDSSKGGGSKLLDEVCQSWTLGSDMGDVVFEARVAS
jgi:signal transduction histidine kinase